MWVLRRARRQRRRADARLPDPPRRAAARRRDRRARAHRRRRRDRRDRGGRRRAEPAPRVVIVSFPHNPTTAVATPELMQRLVDLAREHEFVLVHDFAYADVAFDGHEPPSVLAAEGALDCAVELYSLTKSFSMAGWRVGFTLGRPDVVARAREAEVLPRLRHLPADPDRVDRGAARGRRLPGRGLRDLPQPPRRALIRGLARAGWHVEPPQRDDVRLGADPRAATRELGSLEFALKLAREARRRGQPGHRLRRRAATGTCASRSSRTSSGSARRRARSAGCCRARSSVRHRSFRRRADVRRVLREDAAACSAARAASTRRARRASSSSESSRSSVAALDVEHDRVAVADGGDRAAARTPRARCGRPSARASRREKRPSVISATSSPSPSPTSARGHVQHLAHARARRPGPRSGSRPRRPARSRAP